MTLQIQTIHLIHKINMQTYIISSELLRREIVKNFENATEARHWVINHLDLSGNWTIELSKLNS